MRETLRRLAASGKTVFVSSHLLAEVQVLADVVGIIARGKLVREGTLEAMLNDQGVVRVRVPRAQVADATTALQALAKVEAREHDEAAEQWLAVHLEPSRAAEVESPPRRGRHLRLGAGVGNGPRVALPGADGRQRCCVPRRDVRQHWDAHQGFAERLREALRLGPSQAGRQGGVVRLGRTARWPARPDPPRLGHGRPERRRARGASRRVPCSRSPARTTSSCRSCSGSAGWWRSRTPPR